MKPLAIVVATLPAPPPVVHAQTKDMDHMKGMEMKSEEKAAAPKVTTKASIAAAALVIAGTPFAASLAAPSDSAMEECFKKHAQLMQKPALTNMRDCWRTHAYKMDGA